MGKGAFFIILNGFSIIKSLIGAWMLVTLWSWFIMEPFGAGALTMHTAFGIITIVDFLLFKAGDIKWEEVDTDETRLTKVGRALGLIIFIPIFVMTFAFIGHKLLS